jgi:hypothetical protein
MTVLPDLAVDGATESRPPWASASVGIGGLGDPGTLVLSGPPAGPGGEELASHTTRWGHLPDLDGGGVCALLRDSRLDGRPGCPPDDRC